MHHEPKAAQSDVSRAWLYLRRAMKLRCPECGISPVFTPFKTVRSLFDWFSPLDGCTRCGYAYTREQGYFLLAIWGVNYGVVGGMGLTISLIFEWLHPLELWQHLAFIFLPLAPVSFLFARHAKSIFLAMDHFCDPHKPR
jgi:uncharacterized protein (DUF983 family)